MTSVVHCMRQRGKKNGRRLGEKENLWGSEKDYICIWEKWRQFWAVVSFWFIQIGRAAWEARSSKLELEIYLSIWLKTEPTCNSSPCLMHDFGFRESPQYSAPSIPESRSHTRDPLLQDLPDEYRLVANERAGETFPSFSLMSMLYWFQKLNNSLAVIRKIFFLFW